MSIYLKLLRRYDTIKTYKSNFLNFPDLLIIEKYVKIKFKDRGSPCCFLVLGFTFYCVCRAKTNLNNIYIYIYIYIYIFRRIVFYSFINRLKNAFTKVFIYKLLTPGNNNEKQPVYTLLIHTQRLLNKKVNE